MDDAGNENASSYEGVPMNQIRHAATPVGLFLLAIAVRILSWHSVFQSTGVHPNGNDPYYHLRRIRYSIEHFPEVLDFDPLMNFPDGAQPIWSPLLDWLIAALLRPIPGIDLPERLESIAVCIPPAIGAATVVLLYFVGLRVYSRSIATLAAVMLAILPAHSFYSRLGAIDHHVLVATVATVMLFIAMRLFRDQPSSDTDNQGLRWSAGLGFSIAAAVLIWPGCLFHIGVLQCAMILRLVTANEQVTAIAWARRFAVVHLAACLAVYPLSAGNEWLLWGSLSPVVLSDFQPLYFCVAFLCFVFVSLIWQRGWAASSHVARVVSSGAVAAVVLTALFWAIPDLSVGLADALSWLSKDEDFQSVVNESAPLFAGNAGWLRATMFLSGFVFLVPLTIPFLAWKFRRQPDQLLMLGWASAFLTATLLQWRFMNTYSIAHCLIIAIVIDSCRQRLAPRLTTRLRAWSALASFSVIIGIAFYVPVNSYRSHFENVTRSLRGQDTHPVGTLLHASFVTTAARFLRDHSPPLEDAPYSVLGPWGDGHILKYVAERPVVQDNFGDDVAPQNFQGAEEYFAARDESSALKIISPMRTRFVLVRAAGSGHSRGYTHDSQFTRLYHLKGSSGNPIGPGGRRYPAVEALHRHRLVYRSGPLRTGDTEPYCMLFEVVEGAELVGRANPGADVRVSLGVEPRAGGRFEYVVSTSANAAGVYTARLPYSNTSATPDVRVASHYRIRSGKQSRTVSIPEAAVLEGLRVDGPDFHSQQP